MPSQHGVNMLHTFVFFVKHHIHPTIQGFACTLRNTAAVTRTPPVGNLAFSHAGNHDDNAVLGMAMEIQGLQGALERVSLRNQTSHKRERGTFPRIFADDFQIVRKLVDVFVIRNDPAAANHGICSAQLRASLGGLIRRMDATATSFGAMMEYR